MNYHDKCSYNPREYNFYLHAMRSFIMQKHCPQTMAIPMWLQVACTLGAAATIGRQQLQQSVTASLLYPVAAAVTRTK